MKIALIECPVQPLQIFWQDVYFPDAAFPINDFLYDEPHEVKIWNFACDPELTVTQLVQDLQTYQPVVLGINDNQSTNGLVLERLIKQMFPRALVFFSPTRMALEQLLDQANQSALRLRQRTRPVSGKLRFRSTWTEADLFSDLTESQQTKALAHARDYHTRYQLEAWADYLPRQAYRLNLETLEILSDCFPEAHPIWQHDSLRLLDIGAARWAYAPALYQFFSHAYSSSPRDVYLTGIELDPYRVDQEGYSCVDHALSYIDPIASVSRYLNQDAFSYTSTQPYDVITLFSPYVRCEDHLFSGLPLEFFRPAELLQHLSGLIHPSAGSLLMTQPSETRFVAQRELLKSLAIQPEFNAAFRSSLTGDRGCYLSLMQSKNLCCH